MWHSLPEFGTGVLYAIIAVAGYSFAVALAAARGRPRMLQAARLGAYGTCALVALAVLVLAYAFVSHDFRIAYVAHYSDRGTPTPFLLAGLWGGQDGSLLWWLFLTSLWSSACVWWLGRRYIELQPYVIATLMSVVLFFGVLMVFATNPFQTSIAGAPPDGQGLNHQLRDFYMIIHPPSLYTGFTSSAIPFGFAIAALATGRLDNEWIVASRKWMLFSWLFLSIGNALGMLWAYEELGWGGPWAWDPVENAAFLPWLTATAYLHSIMIQERRGMFKVWNVILICSTFFLTIFGTWLTRSGLIASVHAFAQSGIGIFFVYYMAAILIVCITLIIWRLPMLRSKGELDSVMSREAMFLANNWGLVSLLVSIAIATTWPRISEALLNQKATLGPTFYNTWLPPLALTVFFAMGIAPVLGWRKSSPELFWKALRWPGVFTVLVATLHVVFGKSIGMPAFVSPDPIYAGTLGMALSKIASTYPFFTVWIAALNVAVVVQEFVRGVRARQKANRGENLVWSFFQLVAKSRRRYGGYIVHVGIAVMMVGFAGRAWSVDKEASLKPGESVTLEEYTMTYVGPRMEVDTEKRMIFADVDVSRFGKHVARLSPARFIYKTAADAPSTEVVMYHSAKNDLYMIIGMANPQTKTASFQFHVNIVISFIWIGAFGILLLGALIAMFPDITVGDEVGVFGYVRAAAAVGATLMFAFVFAGAPSRAYAGTTHWNAPPASIHASAATAP